MTKTFKVAAAQVRPVLFDLNGSLNKVLLKIQEAATKDVKLIVFPETFLPYYPYFCLLYTSPSPRDMRRSRMPSSA